MHPTRILFEHFGIRPSALPPETRLLHQQLGFAGPGVLFILMAIRFLSGATDLRKIFFQGSSSLPAAVDRLVDRPVSLFELTRDEQDVPAAGGTGRIEDPAPAGLGKPDDSRGPFVPASISYLLMNGRQGVQQADPNRSVSRRPLDSSS